MFLLHLFFFDCLLLTLGRGCLCWASRRLVSRSTAATRSSYTRHGSVNTCISSPLPPYLLISSSLSLCFHIFLFYEFVRYSDPRSHNRTLLSATGIALNGNDHFITNTIIFSALIGVNVSGAANLLTGTPSHLSHLSHFSKLSPSPYSLPLPLPLSPSHAALHRSTHVESDGGRWRNRHPRRCPRIHPKQVGRLLLGLQWYPLFGPPPVTSSPHICLSLLSP